MTSNKPKQFKRTIHLLTKKCYDSYYIPYVPLHPVWIQWKRILMFPTKWEQKSRCIVLYCENVRWILHSPPKDLTRFFAELTFKCTMHFISALLYKSFLFLSLNPSVGTEKSSASVKAHGSLLPHFFFNFSCRLMGKRVRWWVFLIVFKYNKNTDCYSFICKESKYWNPGGILF